MTKLPALQVIYIIKARMMQQGGNHQCKTLAIANQDNKIWLPICYDSK